MHIFSWSFQGLPLFLASISLKYDYFYEFSVWYHVLHNSTWWFHNKSLVEIKASSKLAYWRSLYVWNYQAKLQQLEIPNTLDCKNPSINYEKLIVLYLTHLLQMDSVIEVPGHLQESKGPHSNIWRIKPFKVQPYIVFCNCFAFIILRILLVKKDSWNILMHVNPFLLI